MANYTKLPLSGSVTGKQILISGTTSASATPIHTAIAGTDALDEVWIYAYNEAATNMSCSILWGGTTEPADVNRITITPQSGRILIVVGKLLQNGLQIKAYASNSSSVVIDGFVNRIT